MPATCTLAGVSLLPRAPRRTQIFLPWNTATGRVHEWPDGPFLLVHDGRASTFRTAEAVAAVAVHLHAWGWNWLICQAANTNARACPDRAGQLPLFP